VDNFRANLPAGITYDSDIARYFCNNRRFFNEWEVERYLNYITKFGFSAAFDPASLFASGEQGAWYDPSDLTTLYQDSAGTTPVTADGDPVGLMLDKSQGVAFEPRVNLFRNTEDFSQGNWSKNNGSTVTDQGAGVWRLQAPAGVWTLFERINIETGDHTNSWEVKSNGGGLDTFRLLNRSTLFSSDFTATSEWQRFSLIDNSSAANSSAYGILRDSAESGIDVLIRFPQVEAVAAFTSYQAVETYPTAWPDGNTVNATQATSAARPTYNTSPARITLDGVDDNMAIDFGAAFTGTVLQGTPNGTIHYEIDVSDGEWSLTQDPAYVPDGGDITGLIAVEGTPSASEIAQTKTYLQNNGAGTDFAGVTSMSQWFRGRSDITKIYSGDWDTSSVTNFRVFALGCSSLTALDVSNWDT